VNWDSGQGFPFICRLNENAGDCYDNTLCGSFLAILECELLDRRRLKTRAETRMAIFEFLERWYNLSWNTKGNLLSMLGGQMTMGKNIEVLVLDDEAIVCERLKEFLDVKGLKVETFTESARAVDRLREKKFDVVVTDIKMPGPTGMDVLKLIKDEQPSTQAIVITAYGAIENFRETEALGAYDYVTKPFQIADIYNLIVKAAKRAKKEQT